MLSGLHGAVDLKERGRGKRDTEARQNLVLGVALPPATRDGCCRTFHLYALRSCA